MQNQIVALVVLALHSCVGLPIDGCPMYGCRPSGTFSFSLDVPKTNATIDWVSDFFIGPIPNAGGCVGNSDSLVCQSNGPGPSDTGYMSVDADGGTVKWRDPILRFPALPLLDTYGDLWGSDGAQMMNYDAGGKPISPQIQLDPNMRPLFDMQIVGGKTLLLVSENGQISLFNTDGVPFASTYLRGNVQRENGTFLPTAPAVVNGDRFYVLTEFSPDTRESANLGLQRLYAIDTHQSMADRISVAWYANFEKETQVRDANRLYYRPRFHRRKLYQTLRAADIKPSVLWDNAGQMLFISLPPPLLGYASPDAITRFFGFQDTGNDSTLVFQSEKSVTNMVMYESNTMVTASQRPLAFPPSNAGPQLWASLPDGKLLAISRDGNVSKAFDLSKELQVNFTITSKIMTVRVRELDEDFLVFGIHVPSKSDYFLKLASDLSGQTNITSDYFIVGYDTPENSVTSVMPLAWMFPTPDNMRVTGQIVGVAGDGSGKKDRIIAFAQTDSAGKLFSVARK